MLQLNSLDDDVYDCAAAQALFDVATQVRFSKPSYLLYICAYLRKMCGYSVC